MNNEEVICVDNVSIGYKARNAERIVASSVNATLSRGELVSLVGRNGAGKSTLLRTMCGYQKPLSGNICYMGKKGWVPTIADLSKLVAVVFAGTGCAAGLRVRDLVALGRSPYTNFIGSMRSADNLAIAAAMAAAGVEHLANRCVASLSDGERQKCMIAKALAQDTPIVVLDEPTAFLDFQSKVSLFAMLKKLASETKKAILPLWKGAVYDRIRQGDKYEKEISWQRFIAVCYHYLGLCFCLSKYGHGPYWSFYISGCAVSGCRNRFNSRCVSI